MSTAREWFESESEFRQLCGDAQSQANSESGMEFAASMVMKANQHGLDTYLSDKQLRFLCRLADQMIPRRRNESAPN